MSDNRKIIQDKGYDLSVDNKRVGLGISMGVGKTLIGIRNMNFIHTRLKSVNKEPKFLVVAPKKSIFKAWVDELHKHGLEHLEEFITFSTYRSINKQDNDYNCVYLDECHNLLYSHKPFLDNFSGRILGLTGTPPKYKGTEKFIMIEQYCPIKYTYVVDDAVEDNILNDYKIYIHSVSLSNRKDIQVKTKKFNFTTDEVSNYKYCTKRIEEALSPKQQQITRVMRMSAMKGYKSKEKYVADLLNFIDGKCLIFASTIDQSNRVCEHSYNSKNSDSINGQNIDDFEKGVISTLSCVEQLSEGANIDGLKTVIIMHAYGNEKKLAQRLGRALRLKPDETAIIHVLMYEDTIDEKWVHDAISDFDSSKITWTNIREL